MFTLCNKITCCSKFLQLLPEAFFVFPLFIFSSICSLEFLRNEIVCFEKAELFFCFTIKIFEKRENKLLTSRKTFGQKRNKKNTWQKENTFSVLGADRERKTGQVSDAFSFPCSHESPCVVWSIYVEKWNEEGSFRWRLLKWIWRREFWCHSVSWKKGNYCVENKRKIFFLGRRMFEAKIEYLFWNERIFFSWGVKRFFMEYQELNVYIFYFRESHCCLKVFFNWAFCIFPH